MKPIGTQRAYGMDGYIPKTRLSVGRLKNVKAIYGRRKVLIAKPMKVRFQDRAGRVKRASGKWQLLPPPTAPPPNYST